MKNKLNENVVTDIALPTADVHMDFKGEACGICSLADASVLLTFVIRSLRKP